MQDYERKIQGENSPSVGNAEKSVNKDVLDVKTESQRTSLRGRTSARQALNSSEDQRTFIRGGGKSLEDGSTTEVKSRRGRVLAEKRYSDVKESRIENSSIKQAELESPDEVTSHEARDPIVSGNSEVKNVNTSVEEKARASSSSRKRLDKTKNLSVALSGELIKKIKIKAIERDISVRQLLQTTLEHYFSE